VDESAAGIRLDHFLCDRLTRFSRSRIQSWIEEDRARVNGVAKKASYKLHLGENIQLEPAELKPLNAFAEDIPLNILYEDQDIVAINKPPGLVVHAGAGCHSGTLVNALLHHFGQLSTVGGDLRPGIVHRLDKGTSGVLLVARTDQAHRHLAAQFASRKVKKIYLALVHGQVLRAEGVIQTAITRDPNNRTRMTSRLDHGRDAYTEYRVLERFEKHTLLEVRIGTGRTHQIRVHLSQLGHPIAGDTLYGAPAHPAGRPWLHAYQVAFTLPSSGTPITLEAPLPPDLEAWKNGLL
jgi:23S rRNA pseudouridine1911/1915/1917 synthase